MTTIFRNRKTQTGMLLLFVLALLIGVASGQSTLVQLSGRISVYPNYGIFQAEYSRFLLFFHGDEYKSATLANGQMIADEENRLSDAMDQIRARDPQWFDLVFQQHGLVLKKIGEQ